MKKFLILVSTAFLFINTYGQSLRSKDKNAIMEVLERQEACWNRGDIPCFMEGYWQNDSLMFIGSRGLTYGWQQTLDNYKKSYPDAASMGQLTFDILHIKAAGKKSAFVIGKWKLTRPEKGDLQGHFSLLWKKLQGNWVIVADHSS